MQNLDPKLLELIRKYNPRKIAEDICSVQPAPKDIDWKALERHPLMQSFWQRHFGKK